MAIVAILVLKTVIFKDEQIASINTNTKLRTAPLVCTVHTLNFWLYKHQWIKCHKILVSQAHQ